MLDKENIPNNILIATRERALSSELIKIICRKFSGNGGDTKNNLIVFNADDKPIENLINECSSSGLFSEKKIVVLKNVKKLLKDAKVALLEYLSSSNPDVCLIMISSEENFEPDKIFFDSREGGENVKLYKKIIRDKIKIFSLEEFSEPELIEWIENKFEGYKISKDTIKHFLQFSNYSLDEILPEIEKLKTYCCDSKEITTDTVNLCNGIAKEFSEMDFIKAILERKRDRALMSYDAISLKKESEVYLVFLLYTAFIAINKLYDKGISKLYGFNLRKELKLWYDEQNNLLPFYNKFKESTGTDSIREIINQLYAADKILKTTSSDKKTVIISLINKICEM